MRIIKISFSEEDWAVLQKSADKLQITVQEFIRQTLFKKEDTIFTPQEAERRACARFKQGEEFSLPDLYSTEEWLQIPYGGPGVFGRRFFNYLKKNSEKIEFSRTVNRRARYRMK